MATSALWSETDDYLERLMVPADPALDAALRDSASAELPEIQVSPLQGKLLHLLARAVGARRILEIGTLGGYSTIWLARALPPGGRLVSLELEPRHAKVARSNLARAGVDDRVEIRIGPALDSLTRLASEGALPFDFAFVDADKANVLEYYERTIPLCRTGALVVVDNVVRAGAVRDPSDPDPNVQGTRRLLEGLGRVRGADPVAVQSVGRKGHDGWLVALVDGGAR